MSVKSPSHHALVENLVCNRVGSGISIGSLNVSAEISNIVGTLPERPCSSNTDIQTLQSTQEIYLSSQRTKYVLLRLIPVVRGT